MQRNTVHASYRLYLSADGTMKVQPVTTANDQFDVVGGPTELFKTPLRPGESVSSYFDVSHDGQRFLVNLRASAARPAAAGTDATTPPAPTTFPIVVNWPALLAGGDR